ncbi:hypothetical protein FHG87_023720, partial [Trinorchestia longiramus]
NTPKVPDGNTPKVPDGNTPTVPDGNTPMVPDGNTPMVPDGNTPFGNDIPVTSDGNSPGTPLASFRPTSPPNPSGPNPVNNGPAIPVAPRVGPNQLRPNFDAPLAPRVGNRPNVDAPRVRPNQRRPNIPCGETSCPPGCFLCIQRNSCGRCLCGNSARICPAVPACSPSCITPGRDGCFTCSCPNPQGPFQRIPGPPAGFSPGPFFPGAGPPPGQVFKLRGTSNGRQPPFQPVIRVNLARPNQLGPRAQSPGRLAIQSIPPELLGVSRFHVSGPSTDRPSTDRPSTDRPSTDRPSTSARNAQQVVTYVPIPVEIPKFQGFPIKGDPPAPCGTPETDINQWLDVMNNYFDSLGPYRRSYVFAIKKPERSVARAIQRTNAEGLYPLIEEDFSRQKGDGSQTEEHVRRRQEGVSRRLHGEDRHRHGEDSRAEEVQGLRLGTTTRL